MNDVASRAAVDRIGFAAGEDRVISIAAEDDHWNKIPIAVAAVNEVIPVAAVDRLGAERVDVIVSIPAGDGVGAICPDLIVTSAAAHGDREGGGDCVIPVAGVDRRTDV